MTTKVLAEQFGASEKNILDNFSNNKDRFKEGKHYLRLDGQQLKEFKKSLPDNIAEPFKFAPQLILWTDRGAARHAKILDTDEAWDVYEELEENYFNPKPQCKEDIWIAQIQEMKAVRLQLEQTKAAVQETKQEVQAIRDTISINPKSEWRKRTNAVLNQIGKTTSDYKTPKDEVYNALKVRGNCRPSILINNLKARALLQGMSKSKADSLNILDVLENEPRLKEIYIAIVKEMAIKYKVT